MGGHTGQPRPRLILYRFKTHRKVPELGFTRSATVPVVLVDHATEHFPPLYPNVRDLTLWLLLMCYRSLDMARRTGGYLCARVAWSCGDRERRIAVDQ